MTNTQPKTLNKTEPNPFHLCNEPNKNTITFTFIHSCLSLFPFFNFPQITITILALPTMEAFSLLKYWRNGSAAVYNPRSASASTTTFVTAVSHHSSETDENDDEEGPFFDLEFSVPNDEEKGVEVEEENVSGFSGEEEKVEDSDSDGEVKFTLSSVSSGDSIGPNVSLSPSDDLFFKGGLLPIEPSSESNSNSKSQFPVSLVKSATKFRVLMLKLKKSNNKPNVSQKIESKKGNQRPQAEKKVTVKFKVEEVPIVSLFTRENSSKLENCRAQKQNQSAEESVSEEKRFSKDAMQRYLKKVRPFYGRTSKRYGEKMRLSGHLKVARAADAALSSPPPSTAVKIEAEPVEASNAPPPGCAKSQKLGNLPAGLREVYKHLGKSRSASSSVAASPNAAVMSKRRDDSLLQQQDGIQSAILHCKRSFKASRDSDSGSISSETQESG